MGRAILLMLAWGLSLPAQRPTAAWPVVSLAVTGNANYSEQQVLAVAGLNPGQPVTVKDFEAARDRLAATGVFEKITFQYGPAPGGKGYAITFEVFEAGPFFPVHFEELPAAPEELRGVLQRSDPLFGEKIPATERVLNRYVKVLEEHLGARGFKEPLAARVLSTDAGEVAVVFQTAAGPPPIAQVNFSGNEVLPTAALATAVNAVAIGMPYKETRFRQILETNLRPLYEARGRVRLAFVEIRTEPAKDVDGLIVTVRMTEGASYNLGQARIDSPVVVEDDLQKIADLRSGDVANFQQVQAALGRIEQRHREEGYMRAAARAERSIDDQKLTVDLTIRVEPGPQYTFGALTIEGLDLHGEDAVRKLWALKEGQRFNAGYPDYFLERIREEHVFDNLGKTKAVQSRNDEARTVDVKLIFAAPEKAKPKPGPR